MQTPAHEAAAIQHAQANAQRHALRFGRGLKAVLQSATSTIQVATIADTTPLLTRGYVVGTVGHGPIHIVWDPTIPVTVGMRAYVEPLKASGPSLYLAHGFAPLPGGLTRSGAIQSLAPSGVAATSQGTLLTLPSNSLTTGWFWSGFYFLTALPAAGSRVVLLDWARVVSGSVVGGTQLIVDSTGHLNQVWYGTFSGSGTPAAQAATQRAFGPHAVWYVQWQAGQGLAVNGGQTLSDMTQSSTSAGMHLDAGTWSCTLLGAHDGSGGAPVGSWISKVLFGCQNSSGSVSWPTAVVMNPRVGTTVTLPTADSLLPNGAAGLGTGLTVYARYLCNDLVGSTVPNSGLAGSSTLPLTLSATAAALVSGPYAS